MDLAVIIKDFGFPILAVISMGGLIFYVWHWVTNEIDPVLGATMVTLIRLVDRVRMLDNELIRMKMKIDTTLELREKHRAQELEELKRQNPQK